MSSPDNNTPVANVRKLIYLLLTDLKLTATEKLSRLLTACALGFIVGLLGLGVLLFLSYSMAAFFSTIMPEGFACMIVAGMYLLFVVLVVIFRRPLLEDPVTRLLSKIILSKPVHRSQVVVPHKLEEDHEK